MILFSDYEQSYQTNPIWEINPIYSNSLRYGEYKRIYTYIYKQPSRARQLSNDKCWTLSCRETALEWPERERECERERAYVDRLEPSTTIVEFSAQSDPDTIFQ